MIKVHASSREEGTVHKYNKCEQQEKNHYEDDNFHYDFPPKNVYDINYSTILK